MNALVVYDSAYGNTQQVAEAIVASPGPLQAMAFYVRGTEGPLRSGELDKAATWAKDLLKRVGQ